MDMFGRIRTSVKACLKIPALRRKKDTHDRIRSLNEQISRHYIYNSLQIIAGLCDTDPPKAKEAIITFSDYLRLNLDKEMLKELVGFSRELENTKVYLALERLASDRHFDVEYRIETEDFLVPPLILQPVVENAVRYGESKSGETNKIVISVTEAAGSVVIEVTNTVPADPLTHNHERTGHRIALQNVTTRLSLFCGGTLSMTTDNEVTKITITIPKR